MTAHWPTDEDVDRAEEALARLQVARENWDREIDKAVKRKEWFDDPVRGFPEEATK